ncbi:glycosyltransferase family 39 protein [Azoarcus sp. DN11]|uniref:ArnT family glycosyltransferase n=1 Tax=Azoarcus sp. DN11 TaxID=356837 RepID=UPI000EB06061|nr:glycosyltransferase family 39 protein [Azoarcus sp. DN11]AYH43377.1 hypothetical protein CDA09_08270 [Azoarcus sp. DN11]
MNHSTLANPSHRRSSLFLFAVIALAFVLYRVAVIARLGLDPYVDEAYYWGWAQALDWGYYSKPPVIAALIAWSGAVFGDNLLALKAPSLILYTGTAFVVREIGRELFDDRVGFWCGLAFLTLPLTATLSLFASTDAPLLFFWAAGMLLMWRALDGGALPYWVGIGVVAGLGLMSKYVMLAFGGSAFLALFVRRGGPNRVLGPTIAVIIALAIFAPNLVWNWEHGFPTFRHTAEITRMGAHKWSPGEFVEFAGAQWLLLGPLLAVCLGWALLRWRDNWADPRFRFLLVFALPLWAVVGLQALAGRANGNWAGPALVAATVLTIAFLARRGRWRLAVVAIALNIVAGSVLYHWPDVVRLAGKELNGRIDPYKRARGWHELAEAVRPRLEAHPDAVLVADERELLAQLVYSLRPSRYARWQPDPHVMDHYGLTVPLTAASGDPVLFVSERAEPAEVIERFADARRLGDVDIAVYPNFHRRASVWLLRGFKGY